MPTSDQKKKITEDIFSSTQKRLKKQGLTRTFYLRKLKELSDSEDGKVSLGAIKEVIKLWDDYPAEKHEHGVTSDLKDVLHKCLSERLEEMT